MLKQYDVLLQNRDYWFRMIVEAESAEIAMAISEQHEKTIEAEWNENEMSELAGLTESGAYSAIEAIETDSDSCNFHLLQSGQNG